MRTKISGGSSGILGVTGDGRTPGGEVIAGSLNAGYPVTASTLFHNLHGSVTIFTTQPILDDQDDTLDIISNGVLSADNGAITFLVARSVDQNGHDFTTSMMVFDDDSTSDVPIASFQKQSETQFKVNPDGVTIHNKIRTGASVAHGLGAYSGNAVPIYDESGTLLGYMPLYA